MPPLRLRRHPGLLVLLALMLMTAGTAQQNPQQPSPSPDPSAMPAGADQQTDQELTTIRREVNVVSVYFTVKKKNVLVPGLTKDDFQVFEDGKQQQVKYFSAETDLPLTLGLLLDTSPSMRNTLGTAKGLGYRFLKEVIRPKDLAFVISFDASVDLLHDFSASADELRKGIDKARIVSGTGGISSIPGGSGPVPTMNTPRGTLLYDAVFLASDEKLAEEAGRKAMVLLTDGCDQGSQVSRERAVEAAQKADTIIYVLLIQERNSNFQVGSGCNGEGEMKRIAEPTGGRVIDVGDSAKDMEEAFQQISAELRSQYSLGYTPTNSASDGTFRKIEIKAKDLKVQARKGYYAREPK